jgi:DNA-binding NtrC family response regulator
LRNVTSAGQDAVDVDRALRRERERRTEKSCGPDAPTLASSFVELSAKRRWQESPVTEESAKEAVKTIAWGMPGDFRCDLTNACALYTIMAHAAIGRIGRPAFPAPSDWRAGSFRETRALARRDREVVFAV